jgi:hypothetical protein
MAQERQEQQAPQLEHEVQRRAVHGHVAEVL